MTWRQSDQTAAAPTSNIAWLHAVLHEANFDPWESVDSAFQRAVHRPHDAPGQAEALERLRHVLETKRVYWAQISYALGLELSPPHHLPELLRWELETLSGLSERQLAEPLDYQGRRFSVAGLLRLNARHSVWHAGQAMQRCGTDRPLEGE